MKERIDLFAFQTKCLQLSAFWPLEIQNHIPKSMLKLATPLRQIFEGTMLILSLHLAILQAKTTYENLTGNLDKLSDSLTATIIYSFCFFATVYFMSSRADLMKLIRFINDNYKSQSAEGLTYVNADESYKKALKLSKFWIAACTLGVTTWALCPVLIGQRVLPIRCWYPFDEKQPVVYEMLYFVQFFAQLQIGFVIASGSALYISIIIIICGQYDILFCSMKNLIYNAHLLGGNFGKLKILQSKLDDSKEEVNQYLYSKERKTNLEELQFRQCKISKIKRPKMQKRLKIALKGCAQHHQFILTSCKLLEEFYNRFCLIKSLQITIQLCLLAFVAVNTTTSFFRAISLGEYLLLTITELLMFTFFGQILREQSLRVGEAILRSAWYLESKHIKSEFLIILPNAMNPVILTAGKFFVMDIIRLRNVVMSAFSYLTLLQTLRDK